MMWEQERKSLASVTDSERTVGNHNRSFISSENVILSGENPSSSPLREMWYPD